MRRNQRSRSREVQELNRNNFICLFSFKYISISRLVHKVSGNHGIELDEDDDEIAAVWVSSLYCSCLIGLSVSGLLVSVFRALQPNQPLNTKALCQVRSLRSGPPIML